MTLNKQNNNLDHKSDQDKPYLILLHGFKRNREDVFKQFLDFFNKNDFEQQFNVVQFEYYDNLVKESIDYHLFIEKITDLLNKYKDKEVYLLGYSLGALASLTISSKFPNIKKIFAIVPVFKIGFFDWPIKLFKNYKKAIQMKKKLGKERYKRLKELKSSGASEKYPTRIVIQVNRFRLSLRKNISNVENKNIKILFSTNDEINNLKKTIKYINDKIKYDKNILDISFSNETHFDLLRNNNKRYQEIISFFQE